MPLKPTKARTVIKTLAKLGFTLERIHGSHMVFKHQDSRITVVPRHGHGELGRGLLSKIALDLRISSDELAKLLEEE